MQAGPFALSCCFRTMSMSSSLCPSTGKADAKICQLSITIQISRRLFLIIFLEKRQRAGIKEGTEGRFFKEIRRGKVTGGGKTKPLPPITRWQGLTFLLYYIIYSTGRLTPWRSADSRHHRHRCQPQGRMSRRRGVTRRVLSRHLNKATTRQRHPTRHRWCMTCRHQCR